MTESVIERKLAAIVYADVAGYSRLTGADEEGTHHTLSAYLDVITAAIAEHGGRVVHFAGDAVLAEFPSVVEAVSCAVAAQRDLRGRNAGVPAERRLEFRIGINLGDIMVDRDDIYGDGVNVAARLESLAEPGGICVSGVVHDQVEGRIDVGFAFMGAQKVKNIAAPVPAYKVLIDGSAAVSERPPGRRSRILVGAAAVLAVTAGLAWLRPWAPPAGVPSPDEMAFALPEKPSIAVLRFTNMSGDEEQEYFSDGITEDLITDLSKISGLFVIARNSTFAYKGKSPDVRQVAKDLGVRYVLEGSVRKVGKRVRINAQLIDGSTGGHVWADRYDGDFEDVFGLQDKVVSKIVATLAVKLTAGEQEQIGRKETENTEAYDAFLKGWEQYLRQRPESFRQAIVLFEKAAELDPRYSRAYAALSATYWQAWKRYWQTPLGFVSPHDIRFKAEEFLVKAMEEPTPLALQVSAAMLAQQGHHDEAVTEGERAVAMDPNDADGYVALADALNLAGKPEKALPLIERAMRLNPHYPTSYLYELGLARFGMEEFDEAAVALQRAVILNPDDRWSSRLLIATLGHLGRAGEAAVAMDRAEANWRGFDPLSVTGVAFWYPFKEPADAERLADGLRKAGVPD